MNPIPAAGILIGVLCGLWTMVMGFTGWYKEPSHASAFFVVIVIEVAGLIWGLRQTAAQGRTYSGQVAAGTLISMIAGIIIVGASFLFTNVAFPEFREELASMYRQTLQQQGKPDAEIASEVSAWLEGQTPLRQAANAFFGTFTTGVVASAIVSVWIHARRPG